MNTIAYLNKLCRVKIYYFKNRCYVEDCLIKSNLFNLSEDQGIDWHAMIVDVTEILIQKPKKQ